MTTSGDCGVGVGTRETGKQSLAGLLKGSDNWREDLQRRPGSSFLSRGLDGCLGIGFPQLTDSTGCHLPGEGMSQGLEQRHERAVT